MYLFITGVYLTLKETAKLSSKVIVPFCYFPRTINESSCCCTSFSAFGVVSVFSFSHSYRYVPASHCFNLHFTDDEWGRSSFCMLICHLDSFFVSSDLWPLSKMGCSFSYWFLKIPCILYISLLSDVFCANIFS